MGPSRTLKLHRPRPPSRGSAFELSWTPAFRVNPSASLGGRPRNLNNLGPLAPATGVAKAALAGAIVIAPPSALATPWARRFPDPVDTFASGWMRIRARARQQGVELPLIISDHADWDELTRTIDEIRPAEVWITHGREEALARWCDLAGIPARALALVGYEDEGD